MGQTLQRKTPEQDQDSQTLMRLGSLIEDIARSSVVDVVKASGLDRQREIELRRQEELQAKIENDRAGDVDVLAQEADIATDAPQRADEPIRAEPRMGKSSEPAGDIDHDSIVDQLNIIRAGKSMDDRDIEQGLKGFIGGLGDAQRSMFFKMLQGISKIVAPNVQTRMKPPAEEPEADKRARLDTLAQRRKDIEPERSRDASAEREHMAQNTGSQPPVSDAPVRHTQKHDGGDRDEDEHRARRQPPIKPKQRPIENVQRSRLLLQD